MGYCVEMEISGIVIPKDKVDACLAAINELHTDENLEKQASGGSAGPSITEKTPVREKKWYSWVKNPEGEGFESLKEAFSAWRYEVEEYFEEGGVRLSYFDGEKLGDDEILFNTIAPFVDNGSEHPGLIECRGEDGCQWRYVFEDGKIKEEQGKIVWE